MTITAKQRAKTHNTMPLPNSNFLESKSIDGNYSVPVVSELTDEGELPSLAIQRPVIKRPPSSVSTIYSRRTVEDSAPDDETAYSCRQNSRDPLVENFAYNCTPFRETYVASNNCLDDENENKTWFPDLGNVFCNKFYDRENQSSRSSLCSLCGVFS
jgi:hypothetical protein